MSFDITSAKELTNEELNNFNRKENLQTLLNVGRSIGQGATFGQGSHIAGIGQVLGGAIYDKLHGKNVLKELYNDYKTGNLQDKYKQGREDFKNEYSKFADKNKALSIGGELVGGLGTGLGSGALKGIALAKKPIANAALSGGLLSGLYGASNTKGVGLDLKNAVLGAGAGALGGAALGKVLPLINKPVEKLLGGSRKLLPNRAIAINEEEKALLEQNIPKIQAEAEIVKETPKTAIIPTNNAVAEQPIQKLTKAESILNPLKTGYQIDATDLISANGMQPKNFRAYMQNPAFWKEGSKGLLGRRWGTLQQEAADSFRNMNKEIKNFVSNAYFDIPDDTIIAFGKENPIKLAQDKINELTNKKITLNQSVPLKKAQDLLFMIQSTLENKDGQLGLSFGNIKDATQQFNALAEMYAKKDNKHASKMFKDIYRIFADYRDTNPLAKRATERYRDFKSINKTLGEIGMDVEKLSNNNNIETRIAGNSRERAGQKMNRALDKVLKVLEKYPELKQFQGLKDKVQLAQIAYDVRPASNEKLFAWNNLLSPIKTLGKLSQTDAQDELQALGYRLLTGKIKPEQFKNVDVFKGGDKVNRAYYRNLAYGNILDTLKNKNLNKDVIEQAYSKYMK